MGQQLSCIIPHANDEDDNPIPDFIYEDDELQLQEAILSSLVHSNSAGETSGYRILCRVCTEEKAPEHMFRHKGCSHVFCQDCISKHVEAKVDENIIKVTCPDLTCLTELEPEICKSIIPSKVFDRWGNALCEAAVQEEQKIFCPYKDCLAFMLNDGEDPIREAECLSCRRLFCAQCKVPWHSEMECRDFQRPETRKREREDMALIELAKNQNWMKCPNCKFFVERTEGCPHILCRCKFEFCYRCGSTWSPSHTGCQGIS
ncbi:hypothetical protein QJS10_CPB19g01981 [Acorus calamus]|uniref:RBR-type E3 ubiquitin transferase n=1 Tax=Acorus calamus TaxID=4465 RepID=A0AAV9CES3_ACOCL|nr:hypothetical protein QJS10_CPB19g01981 [Acorus calamus]